MIDKETFLQMLNEQKNILKPNQNVISLDTLNRICKKMQHGLKFIPINVSSDNLIVEGHHRYVGAIIAGYDLEQVSDYPTPAVLNDIEWKDVEFLDIKYDTAEKVDRLNKLDALYNNLSIEDIESIIE